MDQALFGIPNSDVYIIIGILFFFVIIETLAGYLHTSKRNLGDWIQEMGGYFVLGLLIKPGIVVAAIYLGQLLVPNASSILRNSSFWISLPLFLFVDDLLQYWYHRSAHEYPFLWKLHRTHHQAEEMGFFVSYRNAALYYLMMPNLWWVGLMTFFGGAMAVAIGLILKQIIIISSHSTLAYDKLLYKYKFLHPIATIWERIFITPAFHHAHHGKSKLDDISDPNGNFGNMFSIWDQLFGTATFTRQFPKEYGLQVATDDSWTSAYLYPIVSSKDSRSELSKAYTKTTTTTNGALVVELTKDQNYLWCQCGLSQNQPFCDGSHHGTKIKPQLFKATRSGPAKLCNCKQTKTGPFCDNTHLELG